MTTTVAIKDDMTLSELGQVLVKSGFFADSRDASQAIVKVLAGRELGFGPIASMTGFYIVKGRVSMSANLMAAAVKRSGRYDFRVRKLDNSEAAIEFLEHVGSEWVSLGVSSFTLEDAKRAGTQNLERFPRNMLYARAMSNGVKWFCADVTGGPTYTPDELGEVVDGETGEIIGRSSLTVLSEATPDLSDQPAPEPEARPSAESIPTPAAAPAPTTATTPAPTPAPKPSPAKPRKLAKIAGSADKAFRTAADEWAQHYPRYAGKDGHADYNHILAAALAEGYVEITVDNIRAVLDQVGQRHAIETQAEEAS